MTKKQSKRDKNRQRFSTEMATIDRTIQPNYLTNPCREAFTCRQCNHYVQPENAATNHRNHCPNCLASIHVDITPGDRASLCGGTMEPIGVWVRKNGEWAIIHRCRSCGELGSNRIAADDNPTLLMSIAVKPLALPPFPLQGFDIAAGKI